MRSQFIRLTGNTQGLKGQPLKRLQRLMHRRVPDDRIVTPEFARALTEISREIERQVGVLVDRRGHIRFLIVGDARSVFIPDLSGYRLGQGRLSGLRLLHTHLNHEPLTDDDLTDLALLRLDMVVAIEALEDGLPGPVHAAHLLPANADSLPWAILPPRSVHDLEDSFTDLISALEEEFYRTRRPRSANDPRDRAILIHVSNMPPSAAEESLSELKELVVSAGLVTLDTVIQRRNIDPKFVLGRGRLQSTVIRAMQLGAEVLVFDLNLTPAQVNAVAEFTDLKILDRTQVILDIFAQRAQTREGKIQVELAQLRYILPRLGAKQATLAYSRLTGGIGGRGPGETKLEIDRRRAQDRIALLEREVNKLGDRRRLRRAERTRREVPVVSIVGYTNAGKSTLLNRLTQSEVVAQDALFATLNPVSRRLRFPKEREVVITDTVGFIRSLPPDLMAAFRTTLEELSDADLLLHVIDASREDFDDLKQTVDGILASLDLQDKPTLLVLNKIDQCSREVVEGLIHQYGGVPISALDPATFGPLMQAIEDRLWHADRPVVESRH